jgi:hypothetical protein
MDQTKLFSLFRRHEMNEVALRVFEMWVMEFLKYIILVHTYGLHLYEPRKYGKCTSGPIPYKKASPAPTMTPRMPPHDSSLKLNYLFNFVSIEQNLSSSFTCRLLWPSFFFYPLVKIVYINIFVEISWIFI